MENRKINASIACTVKECANHAGAQNYCTLNVVSIGTHENNPSECKCVDCESFRCGSGKCAK